MEMRSMKSTRHDQAVADAGPFLPPLHIRVGEKTYTAEPADGPITIGRELPAHIQINDPYISRIHVRLEPADDHWVAVDQSRNGIFVDGKPDRQPTVGITEGTTIRLGNPEGVAVSFGLTQPPPTADAAADEAGDGWTGEMTDPGVARAGAAVATRRDELGIAQRELARQKIINAGALISFEKGRSWPRRGTLAKLEEVLQWAPGTIARIRYGGEPSDGDRTEVLTNTVRIGVPCPPAPRTRLTSPRRLRRPACRAPLLTRSSRPRLYV
jgi:FHA domain